MRGPTKKDIQSVFRRCSWSFHLIVDSDDVMRMGDHEALNRLKMLNYKLCKWWLPRRFSWLPLDKRFHWAAFFQGTRDAGTRHLHVLLHVPSYVPMSNLDGLRLRTSIQGIWYRVRDRDGSLWLWKRQIKDCADNRSLATYVSRQLTRASWEAEDVHFSQ